MKVLLSARWLGGAGGGERCLYSIVRALEADSVDLVVFHRLGGPLATIGPEVRVSSPTGWRWRGSASHSVIKGALAQGIVNPLRRRLSPGYDVYLQLFHGADLTQAVHAKVRLLVPSGNHIDAAKAGKYDFIALQAPDNLRFVPKGTPTVLLPPPLLELSGRAERPQFDVPDFFYLTVLNPYGAVKGLDDLVRAADSAPYPIVWCHSRRTVDFSVPPHLLAHPRIVPIEDPPLAQLRYLYEHCLAYLCFSRSEGFGWAVADALRYSRCVVSRPVGVLSFPEAQECPVMEVGEEWEADWQSLPQSPPGTGPRELNWLSPERFRDTLRALVRETARF